MGKIIIQPKNPLDVTPEEVEKLAKAIRVSYPKYKVQVKVNKLRGYGVTWYEVIEIAVVSGLTEEIIRYITKLAVGWARERFKQKQSGRPKAITIFGPKGEMLKSLVLKNATDEPEDTTEEGIHIVEIVKKYRKAPFWGAAHQRLKRVASKLWLRKD
jgi:hypothetical protein